jgi:uncharacterized protein YjbJ (UPF0337 family)
MQPDSTVSTLFALWPTKGEGFNVRVGLGRLYSPTSVPPKSGHKTKGGCPMNKDQAEGKVDQAVGKIKQGVGEAVGNQKLANQGLVDQAKGAAKETWGTTKDAAKQITDSQKDANRDKANEIRNKVSESIDDIKDKSKEKIDDIKQRRYA